ncbi:MAG: hypothetical protein M1157_07015 [Deinococcus sp.]|nr:hypothetical protein [Deinococcus sp.]
MAKLIAAPTVVESAGNKPKRIEEFVGNVNSGTSQVSIAKMTSPGGWVEPGQTPEFDEYTVVIKGMLRVTTKSGFFDVHDALPIYVRVKRWWRRKANGCSTARRCRKELSIWPCVYQVFRQRLSTGTSSWII